MIRRFYYNPESHKPTATRMSCQSCGATDTKENFVMVYTEIKKVDEFDHDWLQQDKNMGLCERCAIMEMVQDQDMPSYRLNAGYYVPVFRFTPVDYSMGAKKIKSARNV